MILLNYIFKRFFLILGFIYLSLTFTSCGIYKPVDARQVSPNADERVKKNLEEGRGFTLMGVRVKIIKEVVHFHLLAQIQCGEQL